MKQNQTKEQTTCTDQHCPQHNSLKTHGRTFTGTVIESKAQKTATVEWQRRSYLHKYERYAKLRTRIKAHNPECLNAKKGDIVNVIECRPLSKTKHFVITEKVGKDLNFMAREELLEAAKVKEPIKTKQAETPAEETQ